MITLNNSIHYILFVGSLVNNLLNNFLVSYDTCYVAGNYNSVYLRTSNSLGIVVD